MADQLTVLYDGDCGICTHTVRALARLDSHRRLGFVSLQVAALPGMPSRDVLSGALHAVDEANQWFVGSDAAIEIARRVPLLRPISAVARLPLAASILDVAYRAVADNRWRLSRLLGLQVCHVPGRKA